MKKILFMLILILIFPFSVNGYFNKKITNIIEVDGIKDGSINSSKEAFFGYLGNFSHITLPKFNENIEIIKHSYKINLIYDNKGKLGDYTEIKRVPEHFEFIIKKIRKNVLSRLIDKNIIDIAGINNKLINYDNKTSSELYLNDKNENIKIKNYLKINQELEINNLDKTKEIIMKIEPFNKNVYSNGRIDFGLPCPKLITYDNSLYYNNLKVIVNGNEYIPEIKYIIQKYTHDNKDMYLDQNPYEAVSIIPYYESKIIINSGLNNIKISYNLVDTSNIELILNSFNKILIRLKTIGINGKKIIELKNENLDKIITEE